MVTTGLAWAYYASVALRINFAGVIKLKNKTELKWLIKCNNIVKNIFAESHIEMHPLIIISHVRTLQNLVDINILPLA